MDTKKIANVIPNINQTYLLPAIQREFVWTTDQIERLFDSILRNYPIGALLLWQLSGDEAEREMKYKFVQHYIENPTFPSSFSEVSYRNLPFNSEYEDVPPEVNLVLDGQQRLTALYIGLTGSYYEHKSGQPYDQPSSWRERKLYMNLFNDPEDSDRRLDKRYDFQFRTPTPDHDADHYWFDVRDILSIESHNDEQNQKLEIERYTDDYAEDFDLDDGEAAKRKVAVAKNISALRQSVHERSTLNFFVETQNSPHRVQDIFVRINKGGTQLKGWEILLSVATSEWQKETPKVVARKELKEFVDEMNDSVPRSPFNDDFMLRALLATSGIEIQYRTANITSENLRLMKEVWLDDAFKQTIRTYADLILSYGMKISHVSSPALMAPVVYYLYTNNNPSLDWNSTAGKARREDILYYLCAGKLNNLTGRSTSQIADSVRSVIDDAGDEFPLETISERVSSGFGLTLAFSEDRLETIFDEATYGSRNAEFLVRLLRYPDVANEYSDYHVDHIIPRSSIDSSIVDRIGNLQLLRADENLSKGNKPLSEWLDSRTNAYRRTHFIPDDKSLYNPKNYEAFIDARERLIRDHLIELFG